jgi:hypothetical protein
MLRLSLKLKRKYGVDVDESAQGAAEGDYRQS